MKNPPSQGIPSTQADPGVVYVERSGGRSGESSGGCRA